MKKQFILISVLAVGTVIGLYSLPRTLVKNEGKTLETPTANRDKGMKQETVSAQSEQAKGQMEEHNKPLSAEQQRKIDALKANFLKGNATEKLKVTDQLIQEFVKAMHYDSAAFYAENMAKTNPSEVNWYKAGSLYYEAYTFANGAKVAKMGEKVRETYQKVLDINPNNLTAKTNMAMTFVATQTPMQGILMLREVIAQDPNNELALYNLGQLSMQSGQFGKAAERFKQILNNHPDNEQAMFLLAASQAELGKKDEAKKLLETLSQKSKNAQLLEAVQEMLAKLH
jgi:tetratricopeptide (TPR) repeat protein